MALKVIKYDPFKRGDTPVFGFTFTSPYVGFSWAGVTCDFAITDVPSPSDNTGAGVIRTAVAITDNGDGTGSASFELTTVESKALAPNTTYNVELQLKDGGGTNVATASTGTVLVQQDYVI